MGRLLKNTIWVLPLLIFGCGMQLEDNKTLNDELTVFSAAGMRMAIEELSIEFTELNSIEIEKNYASSGTLARQIANGAKCDVFISANKDWMDYLMKNDNNFEEGSVRQLAENSLVVVAPIKSKLNSMGSITNLIKYLRESDKIAIGNPSYVPAGKYAKEVFDTLNIYKALESKFVMCKDVSSARHYVELGECDFGFIYYSEAMESRKLKILYKLPDNLHSKIQFYGAVISSSDKISAERYLNYFKTEEGRKILSKRGFKLVDIEK